MQIPEPITGRPRVLTAAQAQALVAGAVEGRTQSDLARQFGISRRTVAKILRGEAYADITGITPPKDKE